MAEAIWIAILFVVVWAVALGMLGAGARADRRLSRLIRDRYRDGGRDGH
jgi:type IV secretory pathway TrbD component